MRLTPSVVVDLWKRHNCKHRWVSNGTCDDVTELVCDKCRKTKLRIDFERKSGWKR